MARAGLGVLALILLAQLAPPAWAEDTTALYEASWSGLPAAKIRMTLHDGADGYRYEIAIRSLGLARWVTKFRGTATAIGRMPSPVSFQAHYDLRKRKDRLLNMQFHAGLAERGPGDTSRKPQLAEKFRRNVIDPLGAFAAIRRQLREHPDAGFTIPVYDGARRFDVVASSPPRRRDGLLHLALSLHAIAGFKGETSDDGDPDDAPRPVELILADDALLTPLSMTVPIYFLPLTVEFVRWCEAAHPCTW